MTSQSRERRVAVASATPGAATMRTPSLLRAAVSLSRVVAIVALFIFALEASLHTALMTAIVWVGIWVVTDRNTIASFNQAMSDGPPCANNL